MSEMWKHITSQGDPENPLNGSNINMTIHNEKQKEPCFVIYDRIMR